MRENKFKVWDNEENKWFEPVYEAYRRELIELFLSPSGGLTLRTMNQFEHCQSTYPDRFKIVFFTGLKDKNGKDVYESDIYREEIELDQGDMRYYYICTWIHEICCFGWLDINDYQNYKAGGYSAVDNQGIPFNCQIDETSNIEIIGNIYENSSLILI